MTEKLKTLNFRNCHVILAREDIKKISKKSKLENLEVLVSFSELGDRGNFSLIDKINGRQFIFKKGILSEKDLEEK